jgi:hypothetical protein
MLAAEAAGNAAGARRHAASLLALAGTSASRPEIARARALAR